MVTVVQGKVCAKNHPDRLSRLATIHQRYRRTDGRISYGIGLDLTVGQKYLESLKVSANNRLARWALALQPYKFTVNYKEGRKLTAADGISRRPFPEPTVSDNDEILSEDSYIAAIQDDIFMDKIDDVVAKTKWTTIHFEYDDDEVKSLDETGQMTDHNLDINTITDITGGQDIQTLQRQCPDFIPIFDYFEAGELPTDDKAVRKIILESEFVIDNGILYHLFSPRTKRLDKMMPVIQQLCVSIEKLRE